jgi:HK97 family phage major capsid protein
VRTLGEINQDRYSARSQLHDIEAKAFALAERSDEFSPAQAEQAARYATGIEKQRAVLARLDEEFGEVLLEGVRSGHFGTEEIDGGGMTTRAEPSGRYQSRSQVEGAALRAVDRHRGVLSAPAGDRLDALIRDVDTDPEGRGPRYIAAVSDPTYERAFWQLIREPTTAHFSMTPEELASIRTAREAERSLSLTGASGGFAVPLVVDPTILATSNGAVNPFRAVSRVVTIAVDEWRGVTSGAITASYAAEATETTDNSPTLAQPTISTEKAQAFVPFSIEIGMDWANVQSELAGLLAESKDELEVSKFTSGTGTNEPFGILTGATNTVNASAGQTFTIGDVYSLLNALPARYQPRASAMASGTIINQAYRFAGTGSNEPPVVSEDRARLLGRPLVENSAMPTVTTTGTKFLVFGDFSRFVIVDRIGLSVELIPHLFGTNHRPTGSRGLYAFWRNSSKVIDSNAFRVLLGVA